MFNNLQASNNEDEVDKYEEKKQLIDTNVEELRNKQENIIVKFRKIINGYKRKQSYYVQELKTKAKEIEDKKQQINEQELLITNLNKLLADKEENVKILNLELNVHKKIRDEIKSTLQIPRKKSKDVNEVNLDIIKEIEIEKQQNETELQSDSENKIKSDCYKLVINKLKSNLSDTKDLVNLYNNSQANQRKLQTKINLRDYEILESTWKYNRERKVLTREINSKIAENINLKLYCDGLKQRVLEFKVKYDNKNLEKKLIKNLKQVTIKQSFKIAVLRKSVSDKEDIIKNLSVENVKENYEKYNLKNDSKTEKSLNKTYSTAKTSNLIEESRSNLIKEKGIEELLLNKCQLKIQTIYNNEIKKYKKSISNLEVQIAACESREKLTTDVKFGRKLRSVPYEQLKVINVIITEKSELFVKLNEQKNNLIEKLMSFKESYVNGCQDMERINNNNNTIESNVNI